MGFSRFLLLLVMVLLVARALRRLFGGVVQGMSAGRPAPPPDRGVRMVRDPVCGTFIVPSRALVVNDRGTARYFCSEKCRDAYRPADRQRASSAR